MTEQAFEAMVRQYEKLVYTVCCQLVHDHQLAEDLSQETFVSAYLHMESCPPGAEKPWLCRIAVNKAKDHLKSAYNRRMAVTEAPGDTAPALAAAQNAPSLEAECETRADAGLARECIEGLAEPYRTVSVLYFMQEWPVEAIARCTPSFTAPKKCCGGSWRRWAERIRAQKVLSLYPGFVLY